MNCPLCNNNSTIFMRGIFDCDKTRVMECCNCKLHFLEPMMSDEEESEYYKDYYENQKTRQKKEYTMKDIQTKAYQFYNEYHHTYKSILSNNISILEIGSGSGGFLKFIKENTENTEIHSIEKSITNLNFLKKEFKDITFFNNLNEVSKKNKYDLIIAFGVLEHIKDIVTFVNKTKSLLKNNDSQILFFIPNNNDILISFFDLEEYKKFMYMKQHYYVFSEKSLYQLAKNCNLTIKKVDYIQVWGIDNHLSWLNDRKSQNFDHYSTLFNSELNSVYKQNLIKNKTTDMIQIIMTLGE